MKIIEKLKPKSSSQYPNFKINDNNQLQDGTCPNCGYKSYTDYCPRCGNKIYYNLNVCGILKSKEKNSQ